MLKCALSSPERHAADNNKLITIFTCKWAFRGINKSEEINETINQNLEINEAINKCCSPRCLPGSANGSSAHTKKRRRHMSDPRIQHVFSTHVFSTCSAGGKRKVKEGPSGDQCWRFSCTMPPNCGLKDGRASRYKLHRSVRN